MRLRHSSVTGGCAVESPRKALRSLPIRSFKWGSMATTRTASTRPRRTDAARIEEHRLSQPGALRIWRRGQSRAGQHNRCLAVFLGKVISATSEQAIVRLDWRRTLVQGILLTAIKPRSNWRYHAGDVVKLNQAGV